MPRVVRAGESKNGLGFEIGTSYGVTPMRSQCLTCRQSSCINLSELPTSFWRVICVLTLWISESPPHQKLMISGYVTQVELSTYTSTLYLTSLHRLSVFYDVGLLLPVWRAVSKRPPRGTPKNNTYTVWNKRDFTLRNLFSLIYVKHLTVSMHGHTYF